MEYCQHCIMPANRPGLKLNENGICGACLWQVKKQQINWQERFNELDKIAQWAKKATKSPWDCVLGVSGGKDSTWQALYIRDKLKMNPLLVQYSCSDGTELGRLNLENLTHHGFDLVTVQPNPKVAQKLSKRSFYKYGNIQKYAEMALFPVPFRTAIQYDIPIVFFGENPALEAGDSNAKAKEPWDATSIRYNNTLGGDSYKIWIDEGVSEQDLILYRFPEEEEFNAWGGKGIFMGYYAKWSGYKNADFAISNGLQCLSDDFENIGIPYHHNSLDSNNNGIVNALLKYIKLGFGNTTEFVCYDIRNNRISREEASLLAKYLDGKCHEKYIEDYCKWIDISINEFWKVANSFRGKMWKKSNGVWKLDNPIWEQVSLPNINYREIIKKLHSYPSSNEVINHE
jgi:N-acetyl sugar amidotransferase